MILRLRMPHIVEPMTQGLIRTWHVAEGGALKSGNAVVDLTVDLSRVLMQDCPPVSHYRVAIRETVWLRQVLVTAGETAPVGSVLAIFTTDPDEAHDTDATRDIRHMLAGIVISSEDDFW